MMYLDLEFPAFSQTAINADHGYHLYAGLCRALQSLHSDSLVGVHPIRGRQIGNRLVQLMPWSSVQLRLPQDKVGDVISLAGKSIDIRDRTITLGVPSVKALEPATALRSRLVTIKGFQQPEEFAEAVRRQLDALEIGEQCVLTVGKRRTLKIKEKEVVGFEVILEGLLASESLTVQESGIGGRRHMGCGMFVRWAPSKPQDASEKDASDD